MLRLWLRSFKKRLAEPAEKVLTKSQCGFRLYVVFIDFWKAFNTVDRGMIWIVLRAFGCLDHFKGNYQAIPWWNKRKVGCEQLGEWANWGEPWNQTEMWASTNFFMWLPQEIEYGVFIHTRSDEKLFNLTQ